MVGVIGKFKGCNTCRLRKVKCDNQRPACKKCIDTGRECGGYERELVFIVGTKRDRGRCSSHPHRGPSLAKKQQNLPDSPPPPPPPPPPETDDDPPVTIEDENGISLAQMSNALDYNIRCLTLRASRLALDPVPHSDGESFALPSLMYNLSDPAQQYPASEFSLRALCLVHVHAVRQDVRVHEDRAGGNGKGRRAGGSVTESKKMETLGGAICLFLYEVGHSPSGNPRVRVAPRSTMPVAATTADNGAWGKIFGGNAHLMKQRGPSGYRFFPEHHFFARLYRKEACFDAMMRRQATFLADPEWCAVPWEEIPKSDMDRLFDVQVLLPGLIERGERLESHPPSFHRRLKAKDLLQNCFQIDKMFNSWYRGLQSPSDMPLLWLVDALSSETAHPGEGMRKKARSETSVLFPARLEFIDLKTAFLHVYYWAALCLFYRSIQHIHTLFAEEIAHPSLRSSPGAFASPLHSPAPPSHALTPPQQPPIQSQWAPHFMPAPPQQPFQPVASPPQSLDLPFAPPQPFMPPLSPAFQPQQYNPAFIALPHSLPPHSLPLHSLPPHSLPPHSLPPHSLPPHSLPHASSSYAVPYPDYPTTSSYPNPPFAAPASLPRASASISASPTLLPQSGRRGPSPTNPSPSYPSESQTSTPTPTSSSSSGSRLQVPNPLPPVPPLDNKYNEAAIFAMANSISQALPYILEHASPSPPAFRPPGMTSSSLFPSSFGPFSTSMPNFARSGFAFDAPGFGNTEAPVFDSSAAAFGSFGPEHALWPLWIVRQVYRRQSRTEYLAWCGQQIGEVRREGWEMARGVVREAWREWDGENDG